MIISSTREILSPHFACCSGLARHSFTRLSHSDTRQSQGLYTCIKILWNRFKICSLSTAGFFDKIQTVHSFKSNNLYKCKIHRTASGVSVFVRWLTISLRTLICFCGHRGLDRISQVFRIWSLSDLDTKKLGNRFHFVYSFSGISQLLSN